MNASQVEKVKYGYVNFSVCYFAYQSFALASFELFQSNFKSKQTCKILSNIRGSNMSCNLLRIFYLCFNDELYSNV